MILGIYLFIPIISKWVRNSNEKEIQYFLVIWLCTLIFNQPFISKYKINIDLSYFSGYIGYLILGHYLTIKSFDNKPKLEIISILLIVLGFIITFDGTYIVSNSHGKFNDMFYNYLTPNVMFVAIGVFLMMKNYEITNRNIITIFKYISKYSYGIYLVHVLFLGVLSKIGLNWKFIHPLIGIPLTTVICIVLSLGVVYIINKIPYGKYISG